jgi:hypothetical protein
MDILILRNNNFPSFFEVLEGSKNGSFILVFILYFNYCYTRGTLCHLQNFSQYITVEFTPSIILFYLPTTAPTIVLVGLIFSIYINVYRVFPPRSPSDSFFLYPLPSHCYLSSGQDMFCFPVEVFF